MRVKRSCDRRGYASEYEICALLQSRQDLLPPVRLSFMETTIDLRNKSDRQKESSLRHGRTKSTYLFYARSPPYRPRRPWKYTSPLNSIRGSPKEQQKNKASKRNSADSSCIISKRPLCSSREDDSHGEASEQITRRGESERSQTLAETSSSCKRVNKRPWEILSR